MAPNTSMGGFASPGHLGASGATSSQASKEKDAKLGDGEKEKTSGKDGGSAAPVTYLATEFPRLGETQCILYTNLAALQIQDGNLTEAEKCCERALQAQPRALAPLRTLVYLHLRTGQDEQALQRLKQSRLRSDA